MPVVPIGFAHGFGVVLANPGERAVERPGGAVAPVELFVQQPLLFGRLVEQPAARFELARQAPGLLLGGIAALPDLRYFALLGGDFLFERGDHAPLLLDAAVRLGRGDAGGGEQDQQSGE